MDLAEKLHHLKMSSGELAVCWLGQAGFLMKDSRGNTLVIDPYLTNCGERLRGFKRLSPVLLKPKDLSPDYYIITHLHFDHFDYDTVPLVIQQSPDTLFLGPASCQDKLLELGAPPERVRSLNRNEEYRDDAVAMRGILADHGDMAPDAIGVLLEMGGHRIYFSGDTAFRETLFREVALFKPDVAMFSINGRFGNMNAQEGARAAALSGVKYGIPCHFWTFAEHGGDPGEFCQCLRSGGQCQPLCFRQGEIQILNEANQIVHPSGELFYRKESA